MKPRVQNAKGSVICADDGDDLLVWYDGSWQPDEHPVFGNHCRGDIAIQWLDSESETGPALTEKPPVFAVGITSVTGPHWFDHR